MSSNAFNKVPYLRTSRTFPDDDVNILTQELGKAYIDIALHVNQRIIGIFTPNKPAVTGESWYFTPQRNQSLRQIYILDNTIVDNSTIDIGFKLETIFQISPRSYGSYTDIAGNWYGIIYASSVPIAGQYSFYVKVNTGSTKTDQIVVRVGAGAPAINNGTIVLEWTSDV
jgi:hypothetical protein